MDYLTVGLMAAGLGFATDLSVDLLCDLLVLPIELDGLLRLALREGLVSTDLPNVFLFYPFKLDVIGDSEYFCEDLGLFSETLDSIDLP